MLGNVLKNDCQDPSVAGHFVDTLAFFPWLDLKSEYRFRDFAVHPYQRGKSPGSTPEEQAAIDDVLASYCAAHGRPVDRAVILQHHCQTTLTAELSADYHRDLFEFAELMAFTGLAGRQFFGDMHYCNRDTFCLVVQDIPEPAKGVLITSRRRDGARNMAYRDNVYGVRCPEHVIGNHARMDSQLMTALLEAKAHGDWPKLYQAITLFSQANTDRAEVPISTEVVFTYAALEQVLGAAGKPTKEVAMVFENDLKPSEPLPQSDWFAPDENQRAADLLSKSSSLRAAWLQDLGNSRGSLAHGHALESYPHCWLPVDHLLFGAHVLPLLIKQRLNRIKVYQLTDEDEAGIEAFEELLNVRPLGFYKEKSPSEHPWHEILSEHGLRVWMRKVAGDTNANIG